MELVPGGSEYYVVESGQKQGPFALARLEKMAEQDELTQETTRTVWAILDVTLRRR